MHIRIALAALAPLLRDILTSMVADEPDLVIVEEFADCEELLASVHRVDPDIIVIGIGAMQTLDACDQVLYAHLGVKTVTIGGDGRRTFLCELRPYRTPLGEVSPQELLEVFRSAGIDRATRAGNRGLPAEGR